MRYLNFLSKDAAIIVNTEEIYPPAVNMGDAPYPADVIDFLKDNYGNVVHFNALELAQKVGNIKTANVVLLGAVSKLMNIDQSVWKMSLRNHSRKNW